MRRRIVQSICITCRSCDCVHLTSSVRTLEPREVQIVRGIADCLSTKLIASRLGMTEGTVATYLSGIYRKMGYEVGGDESPRPRLARWARENAELLGPRAA